MQPYFLPRQLRQHAQFHVPMILPPIFFQQAASLPVLSDYLDEVLGLPVLHQSMLHACVSNPLTAISVWVHPPALGLRSIALCQQKPV